MFAEKPVFGIDHSIAVKRHIYYMNPTSARTTDSTSALNTSLNVTQALQKMRTEIGKEVESEAGGGAGAGSGSREDPDSTNTTQSHHGHETVSSNSLGNVEDEDGDVDVGVDVDVDDYSTEANASEDSLSHKKEHKQDKFTLNTAEAECLLMNIYFILNDMSLTMDADKSIDELTDVVTKSLEMYRTVGRLPIALARTMEITDMVPLATLKSTTLPCILRYYKWCSVRSQDPLFPNTLVTSDKCYRFIQNDIRICHHNPSTIKLLLEAIKTLFELQQKVLEYAEIIGSDSISVFHWDNIDFEQISKAIFSPEAEAFRASKQRNSNSSLTGMHFESTLRVSESIRRDSEISISDGSSAAAAAAVAAETSSARAGTNSHNRRSNTNGDCTDHDNGNGIGNNGGRNNSTGNNTNRNTNNSNSNNNSDGNSNNDGNTSNTNVNNSNSVNNNNVNGSGNGNGQGSRTQRVASQQDTLIIQQSHFEDSTNENYDSPSQYFMSPESLSLHQKVQDLSNENQQLKEQVTCLTQNIQYLLDNPDIMKKNDQLRDTKLMPKDLQSSSHFKNQDQVLAASISKFMPTSAVENQIDQLLDNNIPYPFTFNPQSFTRNQLSPGINHTELDNSKRNFNNLGHFNKHQHQSMSNTATTLDPLSLVGELPSQSPDLDLDFQRIHEHPSSHHQHASKQQDTHGNLAHHLPTQSHSEKKRSISKRGKTVLMKDMGTSSVSKGQQFKPPVGPNGKTYLVTPEGYLNIDMKNDLDSVYSIYNEFIQSLKPQINAFVEDYGRSRLARFQKKRTFQKRKAFCSFVETISASSNLPPEKVLDLVDEIRMQNDHSVVWVCNNLNQLKTDLAKQLPNLAKFIDNSPV